MIIKMNGYKKNILMDVYVKMSKEMVILVFCRILFEVGQIVVSCIGNRVFEFWIFVIERLMFLFIEVRGYVEEVGRMVGDWFRGIFIKQKKKIKEIYFDFLLEEIYFYFFEF